MKKKSLQLAGLSGILLVGLLSLAPLFFYADVIFPSSSIEHELPVVAPLLPKASETTPAKTTPAETPAETTQIKFATGSYAIWTYPFPPPTDWPQPPKPNGGVREIQTFWCAYPSVCIPWLQANRGRFRMRRAEELRLRALPLASSPWSTFVHGHAHYKIVQGLAFLDHLQSTVLCALVSNNPDVEIVDAQTTSEALRRTCPPYDPTRAGEVPLVQYPFSEQYTRRYRVQGLVGTSRTTNFAVGLHELALSRFLPYFDTSMNINNDDRLVKLLFANEKSKFELEKSLIVKSSAGGTRKLLPSPLNIFHGPIEGAKSDNTTLVVSSASPIIDNNNPSLSHFSIKNFDMSGNGLQTASFDVVQRISRASKVITDHETVALAALGMGRSVCFASARDTCQRRGGCEKLVVHGVTLWCASLPVGNVHEMDRHRAAVWGRLSNDGRDKLVVEAAECFGVLPVRRLGEGVPVAAKPVHNLFHFVFTTKATSLNWKVLRAFESVFFHHPNARVIVHSNHLASNVLQYFRHVGYNVTVQKYDPCYLLNQTAVPADLKTRFCRRIKEFSTGRFWYSNESNLMRKLTLYIWGGVYFDTDVYALKSIPSDVTNSIGWQDRHHVNGAVLIFQPRHPMLTAALIEYINRYKRARTNWGQFGPQLLTHVLQNNPEIKKKVNLLPPTAFQPIPYQNIHDCFVYRRPYDLSKTYAIHLNTYLTSKYNKTTPGTLCHTVMNENCMFCSEDQNSTLQ